MGQQLSDGLRHLVTLTFDLLILKLVRPALTFDLGNHGACRWYGFPPYTICVSSLKFVGLSIRKILCTFGLSISRPGDLDLWPLNLKLVSIIARGVDNLRTNFGISRTFHFSTTYRPIPVRRITWPCDFDLWPWRSRHLSLMRVFMLHLCTKFEVRRLFRLKDIGHLLCEH